MPKIWEDSQKGKTKLILKTPKKMQRNQVRNWLLGFQLAEYIKNVSSKEPFSQSKKVSQRKFYLKKSHGVEEKDSRVIDVKQ